MEVSQLSLPLQVATLTDEVRLLAKLLRELLNSPNDQAEVLSVEDVSRITGYANTTVYQYVHRGIIPHHKTQGRRKLIFYRSEIENWLRGQKQETSEEYIARKEKELLTLQVGRYN